MALALLAVSQQQANMLQRDDPATIACLGEKTITGVSDDRHLMHHDETGWHTTEIRIGYQSPWRATDGRLFAFVWTDGGALILGFREGDADPQRWLIPEQEAVRFAFLDGNVVATNPERMYRLSEDSGVKEMGPPPYGPRLFRSSVPPVMVGSKAGPIVCTPTSLSEASYSLGFCRASGHLRYEYRVEFGSRLAAKDEDRDGNGAEPFACGEVLISARKPGTQARRLTDGTLVGRARLYARKGSVCLPDGRVLIVDRREVGTFASPDLRPLWHRRLPVTIQSAAFCGGKIAVLPTSTSDLTFIEVPP